MNARLFLALVPLTLAACDRPAPPPPGTSGAKGSAAAQPPAPPGPVAGGSKGSPGVLAPPAPSPGDNVGDLSSPTVTLSGVTLTIPESWKRVAPSNSMRLVEVRVPDPAGNASQDCVAAFSQAGGTVQWNLDRWKTQVHGADGKPAEADIGEIELNGIVVHTFVSTGIYQDGMPGATKTPRDRWTLRGAVLETTPNLTFIKMTGPMRGMASAELAWNQMLHSMVKASAPTAPNTNAAPSAAPSPAPAANPNPAAPPAGGTPPADPPQK